MVIMFLIFYSVDGSWGEWESWSLCSTTCGEGERTRMRECDSPAPLFDGKNCTGAAIEIKPCNDRFCPGMLFSKHTSFSCIPLRVVWYGMVSLFYYGYSKNS